MLENTYLLNKQLYDTKVAGNPLVKGDKVWLHNTVVPCGHSKKFNNFWKGMCFYKINGKSRGGGEVEGANSPSDIADRIAHLHGLLTINTLLVHMQY